MNLHAIAAPFAAIVNPPVSGVWRRNTGYTTLPSGTRVPRYDDAPDQSFQVQALSGPDLGLVEGLNIQGVERAVFMNGLPNAVDRKTGAGGDLLVFGGDTWLVAAVLESWGVGDEAWSRVAVVKQIDVVAAP